jgi:hypothetical protein
MKYSLVALTLATAVLAKPAFTNTAFDVQEGKPFQLTFTGCESGCTILLKNGPASDLKTVDTLTTSATGSFTWTPEGLPSDTYAFEIKDTAGEVNWSSRFEYEGTGAPKTESKTSAAQTTTKKAEPTTETTLKTTKAQTTTSAEKTTAAANTTTPVSTPAATTSAGSKTTTKGAETTSGGASQPTTVPNNGAMRTTSSLALIAGAVMAFAFLN